MDEHGSSNYNLLIMPVALYKAKLAEKIDLTSKFIFFQFELTEPHRIEFKAGQYLLLNVPGEAKKRQYSIVSAPRLDHAVKLLVELVEGGKASTYLSAMNIGDEAEFFAPAGEFTISEEVLAASMPLVFIATGSGLAPLRSMILDLLRTRETKRPIMLYWGMRFVEDLFWLDYFEELKDNFPNFDYHIALSKPPEGWKLCSGRVTNCLSVHAIPESAHYYICGNGQMVLDAMEVLKGRGVSETSLHHEKFT